MDLLKITFLSNISDIFFLQKCKKKNMYIILNVKPFYVRFLSYGDLSVYDFFFKFSKDP